jgi:hypothetical protein
MSEGVSAGEAGGSSTRTGLWLYPAARPGAVFAGPRPSRATFPTVVFTDRGGSRLSGPGVVTGTAGVAGDGDDGAMRLELHGLQVLADEWSEWCATVIENAGGYAVTVSSVLVSRAVTLVSCYLADLAGASAVSQLRLASGQRPAVSLRVLDGLPGQSHARACLLDHAAQLRDAVGDLLVDEEVGVELGEETLERASRVWMAEHG